MRSSENPELKVLERINCLNLFSVLLLRPVEALSTSIITVGSSPKRCPMSRASAAAMRPAAETKLFKAFMA